MNQRCYPVKKKGLHVRNSQKNAMSHCCIVQLSTKHLCYIHMSVLRSLFSIVLTIIIMRLSCFRADLSRDLGILGVCLAFPISILRLIGLSILIYNHWISQMNGWNVGFSSLEIFIGIYAIFLLLDILLLYGIVRRIQWMLWTWFAFSVVSIIFDLIQFVPALAFGSITLILIMNIIKFCFISFELILVVVTAKYWKR